MRFRTLSALAPLALASMALTPSRLHAQHFTGSAAVITLPAPVKLDTTGMFQSAIASVGDDMFIGGQPTARALREMKARGVTTVVNLRTPEEMQKAVKFDEVGLIKELGFTYVYLPVRGNDEFPYSPATVAQFSEALKNAHGKVLLHCTVGWRASHLWAAYLIKERGVSVDSALANARLINLMDDHHTGTDAQPVESFLGRRLTQLGGK